MRVVIDTNVLVSAQINPSGIPAQVVDLAFSRDLHLLVDARILAEYREVLSRPRFGFDPDGAALIHLFEAEGEHVVAAPLALAIGDPKDLPFLEGAVSGQADALATGNAKHFPTDQGVSILSPRALLVALARAKTP